MASSSISQPTWSSLLPPNWRTTVQAWLQEDIPGFDIGGFVVGDKESEAHLYQKSPGVLCGVPFFTAVFESLDCKVEWLAHDGDCTSDLGPEGRKLMAVVRGPVRKILLGERTALNIITRASGVATLSHETVSIATKAGWTGMVSGTRKTTPGFRLVEKYALLVGGAATHRYDLSQMVMLKDNHVWSAGNITRAVHQAKQAGGFSSKIEVEARTLEEALEAARAGADIVMLDNFDPPGLKAAAQEVKKAHPHVLIEASGGITNDTIHEFFSPHVDIISRGALTQGYGCLDFSLKIQKAPKEHIKSS